MDMHLQIGHYKWFCKIWTEKWTWQRQQHWFKQLTLIYPSLAKPISMYLQKQSLSKRTSFPISCSNRQFLFRFICTKIYYQMQRTRKRATCRWPLSDASWIGVNPALSFTINSCFVPACTRTVQASEFPPMAAQCNGVQPISNKIEYLTSLQQISKAINKKLTIW